MYTVHEKEEMDDKRQRRNEKRKTYNSHQIIFETPVTSCRVLTGQKRPAVLTFWNSVLCSTRDR